MNGQIEFDELTLMAFVDDQLDDEMKQRVLEASAKDAQMRETICTMRQTKDWVRTGFAETSPGTGQLTRQRRAWNRLGIGVAASLVALTIGIAGGVIGHMCATRDAQQLAALQQQDTRRIVLHLVDSKPEHFQRVLNDAEKFLLDNADRDAEVEVITNAGGLDLVRVGVSPVEERVRNLKRRFPNLHFVACGQSIRKLRKEGIDPSFIPDVRTDTTAVEQIVKRLQDGWAYQRIGQISPI